MRNPSEIMPLLDAENNGKRTQVVIEEYADRNMFFKLVKLLHGKQKHPKFKYWVDKINYNAFTGIIRIEARVKMMHQLDSTQLPELP